MNILPVVPALRASEAVTALLGSAPLRVYEDIAPDNTPLPYAVWQVVSGTPENYLDSRANLDHVSFQIVVYDTQPKRAQETRAVIRAVLEKYCYITNIHPSGYERDTKLFSRGFDANWYLEQFNLVYNSIGSDQNLIGLEANVGKVFDLN